MKTKLLATSNSLSGISRMINQYFLSCQYSVSEDLKITHGMGRDINKDYIVKKVRSRYQFHRIEER